MQVVSQPPHEGQLDALLPVRFVASSRDMLSGGACTSRVLLGIRLRQLLCLLVGWHAAICWQVCILGQSWGLCKPSGKGAQLGRGVSHVLQPCIDHGSWHAHARKVEQALQEPVEVLQHPVTF